MSNSSFDELTFAQNSLPDSLAIFYTCKCIFGSGAAWIHSPLPNESGIQVLAGLSPFTQIVRSVLRNSKLAKPGGKVDPNKQA
jgi:hypothetical protein